MQNIKEKLDNMAWPKWASPPMVLSMGFLILIIAGALILSLGICSRSGHRTSLTDALFVAGSASCVTGLTPVNTAEHWNFFGQLIILILIQIGGLGIMSATTVFPIVLGQRIGIKSRLILLEQFNLSSLSGLVKFMKHTLRFTFSAEILGAAALATRFIPDFGLLRGSWYAIFHSISAFCNAGFDVMGDSIYPYRTDLVVNLSIMALVIIGGLGFFVNMEIIEKRSFKKLSVHSKLVLSITAILLIFPTVLFLILEYSNPGTLAEEGWLGKILESAFQVVGARTAGFYSIRHGLMRDQTVLLLIMLMFIGGSPGSTAGGIKTTTMGVLVLSSLATIKGKRDPEIFHKRIGQDLRDKALALIMTYLTAILVTVFVVSILEDLKFIDIFYEVVSAYATVGASKGITPYLGNISKILITISMYIGRLGPMTVAFALAQNSKEKRTVFPKANIPIG